MLRRKKEHVATMEGKLEEEIPNYQIGTHNTMKNG